MCTSKTSHVSLLYLLSYLFLSYLLTFLLSRQEIESLRDVKKGWQKNKTTKKSNTILLEKELNSRQDQQIDIQKIMPKKDSRPETSMDFERDWRRFRSSNEKKQ